MPRAPSPRRYAQAVFQIALERDELDIWYEDLGILAGALENREFLGLLDAPQASSADKQDIIRQALSDSVGTLPLNLVCLLASRNLAHLVPGILDEYSRLRDAYRGIERAEVVSAVLLASDQQERMAELLHGVVGKEIRLASIVEPQILGGVIARVGDRVIDGSLRAKLREMRRSIVEQAG